MTPPLTTDIDNPVAIVVQPHASETNLQPPLTRAYLNFLQYLNLAAISARGGPALRHLYAHYNQRVDGIVMPHSTLGFIISSLLALLEISSQSQTNSWLIRLAVFSLLMYGLASAAELIVSAPTPAPAPAHADALDRKSAYASIARWGRIGCLCILIVSMSSLLCL